LGLTVADVEDLGELRALFAPRCIEVEVDFPAGLGYGSPVRLAFLAAGVFFATNFPWGRGAVCCAFVWGIKGTAREAEAEAEKEADT
jgi:hypothetical protein